MRFGTCNVRSLYRSRSFMTAVRGLARCKLYLVCVQEVRWDMEREEPVKVRVTCDSGQGIGEVQIVFSVCAGG
jgi:hypothetical protein